MPLGSMSRPTRFFDALCHVGNRAEGIGGPPTRCPRHRPWRAKAVRPRGLDRTCVQSRSAASETCRGMRRSSASPANSATTPPSARNGPNGTAVLRPSRDALAGDDHARRRATPAMSAIEASRARRRGPGRGPARRRASRRPSPSPAGTRARRAGRTRRAAAPAISCSGTKPSVERQRRRRARATAAGQRDPVRDQAVLEVDQRDRHQERDEQRARARCPGASSRARRRRRRRARRSCASTSG